MNEERPQLTHEYPEEQGADPSFDLRRGLIVLVIVITIMVIVTLICVWLANRQQI